MKKIVCLLLITNCSLTIVNSQTQFQRTIGGTNHDYAWSIIKTTDGGFALAGYTYSFAAGFEDMYIVKLNSSGSIQWTRTVGGTGDDQARSITQTTDGGYAVAGYTNSFGAGNGDIYIVKLDAGGTLQWSRTIGRTANDYAFSIIQTTDGGCAAAGLVSSFGAGNSDMFIVKFDAGGSLQWSTLLGGFMDEPALSIIQTTDGGFAAAGYSNSFGTAGNDFYIVKLNSGGTYQWSRTIGGGGSDVVNCIIQTADSGFALAGETQSFGAGNYDMYIVKLTSTGTLQWTRSVGGTSEDRGYSIVQTTDGGYAVAGFTNSFGVMDFYTVKLDGSGTLQWSRAFGGSGVDIAYSIIKTTDGGFAVAGQTLSFGAGANDMFIVKLDAGGNSCGNHFTPPSISGTGGTLGSPTPTITPLSPTVTSPAPVTGSGGTLTTICIVGIQPVSNGIPASYEFYQNYPNPFNPVTKIKFDIPKQGFVVLKIYDALGSEITSLINEQLQPGSFEINWDGSSYASGIYFYRIISGDFSEVKKMLMIK